MVRGNWPDKIQNNHQQQNTSFPCLSCPVLSTFQESPNLEDEGRRFILSYFLSNDMISIFEKPTRNSGIICSKFLEKTRVPKPGSTVDNPEFYSPADFAIGATVEGNVPRLTAFIDYSVIMSLCPKGILRNWHLLSKHKKSVKLYLTLLLRYISFSSRRLIDNIALNLSF